MQKIIIALFCLLAFSDLPAQEYFRRRSAVVSAASPYWTDTNKYILFDFEPANTTATGIASIGGAENGPFACTSYPSVGSGPAQTIVGTNSQGRVEYGYTFDNSDDYFYSGTIYDKPDYSTTNLSVGVWIKSGTVSEANDGVINFSAIGNPLFFSGLNIGRAGSVSNIYPNVQGMSFGSYAVTSYNLSDWTHIAMSWDGQNISTYTNGVLANTYALTNAVRFNQAGLLLGTFYALGTYNYHGLMDEAIFSSNSISSNAWYDIVQHTHPTNNLRARP